MFPKSDVRQSAQHLLITELGRAVLAIFLASCLKSELAELKPEQIVEPNKATAVLVKASHPDQQAQGLIWAIDPSTGVC